MRSFEGGLELANSQGIVSPAYTILRSKKPFAPFYYDSYFHTDEFINHVLYKAVEGIRDGRQISYEAFKWLPIPYCEFKEQEKISNFVCVLNDRIVKQRALVESLKKYKRGVLKRIFAYHDEWDEVCLGSIADIYQPQTISADQLIPNGKYPVYGANGLIGRYNDFNHSSEQIAICCRGASCGTVNYIPAYSWITGNAMVINIQAPECLKKFVYYQLCSQNLSYMISGSGQPQIVRTPCIEHRVFLPTKEYQATIVKFLELIDDKINLQERCLEQLLLSKKGFMQKLFI